MRRAPLRELQDHAGPKLFRHVLSPTGAPRFHGASRSQNRPLYATVGHPHPGLHLRPSGDAALHRVHQMARRIAASTSRVTARRAHFSSSFTASSLSVGPSRKAADLGASEFIGGAGRTQQKGELIGTHNAFSFPFVQLVSQPVSQLDFAMGATPIHLNDSLKALMDSLALPLLGRLNAPSVVPTALVLRCKTFREAVRMAWALRRVHYMTIRQLAIDGGFYPQHVGDWLNQDDRPTRRSLPAECISRFEVVVGNTLISQWLAHRSALTVLEEMQASRALA